MKLENFSSQEKIMFLSIVTTSLLSLMSLLMFQETKDSRIFFVPVVISIVQSLLLLKSSMESRQLRAVTTTSVKSTNNLDKKPKPIASASPMGLKPTDSPSS